MNFEQYPKVINERSDKPPNWIGLTIFLFGLFFALIAANLYFQDDKSPISLNKRTNILFLGIDEMLDPSSQNMWRGRSDTIVILSCDPETNAVNILNIPRDTKIKINKTRLEKINFLNAIGGPNLTRKNLEKLLKIKIHNYVVVNLNGLSTFIDDLGGVEIDVPKEMHYEDRTAMLKIDLMPGKKVLSGDEVIQFVRFRHDGLGDIGRIQRQQEFIDAVHAKLKDPKLILKIPILTSRFKDTILTDMKTTEIIKAASFVQKVPSENRKMAILPGKFGQRERISYWIPKKKETLEIVEEFFR